MSALEVGNKLVQFCKEGKNLESIKTLYADDVQSIEAAAPPAGGERITKGKEGVIGKNQWWVDNHEVHESIIEGPFPHGEDKFAVIFKYDVTSKPMGGQRFKMEEVGVFHLNGDGKVAKEEFFYTMG